MKIPTLPMEDLALRMTEERCAKLDAVLSRRTRHFTLVLEDLYDPHNISAIIRTCEVFGIQNVHIIEELNSYRINRDILKGALKWMTIRRYKQRATCMRLLREQGFRIAVASTNTTTTLSELDLTVPIAFYLGTELAGNHPDTLAQADVEFILPQYGITESLNVSVAAGVLLARVDEWMSRSGGRALWTLKEGEREALRREWFERQVFGIDARPSVVEID